MMNDDELMINLNLYSAKTLEKYSKALDHRDMIHLHFHLQPQFKYNLFYIYYIHTEINTPKSIEIKTVSSR